MTDERTYSFTGEGGTLTIKEYRSGDLLTLRCYHGDRDVATIRLEWTTDLFLEAWDASDIEEDAEVPVVECTLFDTID